jgi:hypothetical protein
MFTKDEGVIAANAFAELEKRLLAIDASGHRIAAATTSLRKSAKIFAAASARLTSTKRGTLRLVR